LKIGAAEKQNSKSYYIRKFVICEIFNLFIKINQFYLGCYSGAILGDPSSVEFKFIDANLSTELWFNLLFTTMEPPWAVPS
jgi:hypothetical protein